MGKALSGSEILKAMTAAGWAFDSDRSDSEPPGSEPRARFWRPSSTVLPDDLELSIVDDQELHDDPANPPGFMSDLSLSLVEAVSRKGPIDLKLVPLHKSASRSVSGRNRIVVDLAVTRKQLEQISQAHKKKYQALLKRFEDFNWQEEKKTSRPTSNVKSRKVSAKISKGNLGEKPLTPYQLEKLQKKIVKNNIKNDLMMKTIQKAIWLGGYS